MIQIAYAECRLKKNGTRIELHTGEWHCRSYDLSVAVPRTSSVSAPHPPTRIALFRSSAHPGHLRRCAS
ncbi:hypothetical protein BJV78DRAFT_404105 [Lactifluus subvellereus]|nr:hypothetical protein BJV78DRAFT_404105 [Lactifluus subvellereus]